MPVGSTESVPGDGLASPEERRRVLTDRRAEPKPKRPFAQGEAEGPGDTMKPTPGGPPRTPFGTEARTQWHLESVVDGGRQLRRLSVHPVPFRIGRRPGLELTLPSDSVSKVHAEIYRDGEALRLRDLGSTNGTFVNREPIQDAAIHDGDVIHFADFEFRLGQGPERTGISDDEDESGKTMSLGRHDLPQRFIQGTRELKDLIANGAVTVVFQPIVLFPGQGVAAYEALGRGRHPNLPESPVELFRIAESAGLETELSRLFRRKAVELVRHRTDMPTLFLNTHPAEMLQPGLLESLHELRVMAPHLDLALEIHESVLAGARAIAELRTLLSEINVGLAYDDFGAGQARLLELAEAPPHFLKFDMRFVSGIDQAPPSRRRLLASLVGVARDLLVKTVAEGIETAGEADVCNKVGFTHAQGYHFGRPAPVESI
jgi:EAL domain-containing protein (putative c-di-GMP-specific phosphodiesterase class I)